MKQYRSAHSLFPTCRLFLAALLLNATAVLGAGAVETRPAQTRPAETQQAEAQPAENAPAAGVEAAKLNAWELYRKGGAFMVPLTVCSVLAVALIIERFLALRRRAIVPLGFVQGLRAAAPDLKNNREAAITFCRANDSPIARMLAAGIKRLPRGIPAAEKAIEDAGANEALKLRRNMRFLYALGSVATLLGLIGTISGIMQSFQKAAAAGTGRPVNVAELSTGIYEAMVNTFGGLAVAIIVTIFYYYFIGRIERLISELNDTLVEFTDEYGLDGDG